MHLRLLNVLDCPRCHGAPRYDQPQTESAVPSAMRAAGIGEIERSRASGLNPIGRKADDLRGPRHSARGRRYGPMGAGSIIGAVIGGIAAAHAPGRLLKLVLGLLLIVSALRALGRTRSLKTSGASAPPEAR